MNQILPYNYGYLGQGYMPGLTSMNPFASAVSIVPGYGMTSEGVSFSPEMLDMYGSNPMLQMQQMMMLMMMMLMMMMMKMMGGSMLGGNPGKMGMPGMSGGGGFPGMGFPGFPGNYPGNLPSPYGGRYNSGNHNTGSGHISSGRQTGNVGPATGRLVSISGEQVDASIAPNLQAMINAAKQDGVNLDIISGYRSHQEQQALYDKYGPGRAAKPGTSNHEKGMAVDFANTPGAYKWLAQNASRFGLKTNTQAGGWEPWHVSPTGR